MKKFILVLFIGLGVFFSCSKKSANDPNVVAQIGKKAVTLKDVQLSTLLNPQYRIRTPLKKVRESQLNYLVHEKMYLIAAEKSNLEKDPVVRKRLNYIRKNETVKAFIKDKFLDNVTISNEEILQKLAWFDKKVHVQHLFAPDSAAAQDIEKRLKSGETFHQIAEDIYTDKNLKESGGDLGYVGFGDMDASLEDSVFDMRPGEVSGPVRSAFGYHIMKVLDIKESDTLASAGLQMKVQAVTEVLKNRKADKIVRRYLEQLSGHQKIKVNNRVLDVLVRATCRALGAKYARPSVLIPPINNSEIKSIQLGVEDVKDQVLVEFGDKKITVADFLERLKEMPPFHRPYLKTRKRMIQAIIDNIRTDLLLAEAQKEGFVNHQDVRANISRNSDEYLISEFKSRITSDDFKKENEKAWQSYMDIFSLVSTKTPVHLYQSRLFTDVSNPDSVILPPATPVFLKSSYVW